MRVIFFGTPPFASAILQALIDHGVDIVAVVTKPDRPKGRSGTPQPSFVKQFAQQKLPHIPLFQPPKISSFEFKEPMQEFNADLFIVVAFGEIIKQHLLDMPRLGCINIHASLLPKYRGAAPIQRSLMNGDTQTGITFMYMVKELDAGDIISQVICPITDNMTAGELEQKLCLLAIQSLPKLIDDLNKGSIHRAPQDPSAVTFASKVELEDGEIDWKWPAKKIHNIIRGLSPRPSAWVYVNVKGEKKRVKLIGSSVKSDIHKTPGKIISLNHDGVVISCGEDALLIKRLQLEGKKEMTSEELLRGTTLDFSL